MKYTLNMYVNLLLCFTSVFSLLFSFQSSPEISTAEPRWGGLFSPVTLSSWIDMWIFNIRFNVLFFVWYNFVIFTFWCDLVWCLPLCLCVCVFSVLRVVSVIFAFLHVVNAWFLINEESHNPTKCNFLVNQSFPGPTNNLETGTSKIQYHFFCSKS